MLTNSPPTRSPTSFSAADYRRGPFYIGIERENHDSTLFPFVANRYYAQLSQRLFSDTTYLVNTNYSQVDYPDEDNHVNFLTISGQLSQRFSRELNGFVTVVFRNDDDENRGTTRGLEEQIEMQWYHRPDQRLFPVSQFAA
jgi:hypothetical protein